MENENSIRKIRQYILKHHRWIIGAALIPLIVYSLQKRDGFSYETAIYHFVPLSDNDLDISKLKNADCWISSLASNRTDAFRCSVGNVIYDPCFEDPFTSNSIISCPSNPYDTKSEYFKMISRPKKSDIVNEVSFRPWYIKLSNDQECRMLTGESVVVADKRMDYGCGEGDVEELLLPLEQNGKLLKIDCYKNSRIEKCQIRDVWY